MSSPFGVKPYGEKKTAIVHGRRMAYVEQGSGAPIVFQHGNPASSYLWRNIMPHLEGLGRLIACDLIGMGDSEKLDSSGPDRYTFEEQREYLSALWEQLEVDRDVVLVIHDWGSVLGFDWANRHRDRVAGIAYMEAIVSPLTWDDWTVPARREAFEGLRSPAGEKMVLEDNFFVETHMPNGILRKLSAEEMAAYVRPFANPGEDRRPTLTFPAKCPSTGLRPMLSRLSKTTASGWRNQMFPSSSSMPNLVPCLLGGRASSSGPGPTRPRSPLPVNTLCKRTVLTRSARLSVNSWRGCDGTRSG